MVNLNVVQEVFEQFRSTVNVELSQYDEALHEAVVTSIAWDFEEMYEALNIPAEQFKEYFYKVN